MHRKVDRQNEKRQPDLARAVPFRGAESFALFARDQLKAFIEFGHGGLTHRNCPSYAHNCDALPSNFSEIFPRQVRGGELCQGISQDRSDRSRLLLHFSYWEWASACRPI